MKKKPLYIILIALAIFSFNNKSIAQVGIGTTNPTETLHVNGNVRVDGALMPGNVSGNANQVLISGGVGIPPTWGPVVSTNISGIKKWFVGPFNINSGTYNTLNITDTDATSSSQISVSFVGSLPLGPLWGYDFTVFAEASTDLVTVYITNTSLYNISNLQIVYTAQY